MSSNKHFFIIKIDRIMATVLEKLMSAKHNLSNFNIPHPMFTLVRDQITNAVETLEKGYSPNDDVDHLVSMYGSVENIPEKEEEQNE